jgi:hypothetical protein
VKLRPLFSSSTAMVSGCGLRDKYHERMDLCPEAEGGVNRGNSFGQPRESARSAPGAFRRQALHGEMFITGKPLYPVEDPAHHQRSLDSIQSRAWKSASKGIEYCLPYAARSCFRNMNAPVDRYLRSPKA